MPSTSLPAPSLTHGLGQRLALAPAVAVIALLALVQRWFVMPNADVAWLLTVADRMLDGQRLYVDVLETNPPFSVWLYLPATALSRLLHLPATAVWDGLVFIGAGLSLGATLRSLRRNPSFTERHLTVFAIVLAAVLLLLPAACFGEREHVALLAILPVIAQAALHLEGQGPRAGARVGAALCIGFVLCIKPHFALALAPLIVVMCLQRRSWHPLLLPEYVAGGGLVLLYAAATWLIHPAFWAAAMPLNAEIYLPLRYAVPTFLWHFVGLEVGFAALLALTWFACRPPLRSVAPLMAASACGFLAAVVIQGKGMPYHFYPALSLATLVPFAAGRARRPGIGAHHLTAVLLATTFWAWFNSGFDFRGVLEAVRHTSPRARVLALGSDFSIGPPVARAAGGLYVGRVACQWIADFAASLQAQARSPEDRARLQAYIDADRTRFVEDLLTQRPDVLFIQRGPEDWEGWARQDPRFATAMADYVQTGPVTSAGMRTAFVLTYDMWTRKPPAR